MNMLQTFLAHILNDTMLPIELSSENQLADLLQPNHDSYITDAHQSSKLSVHRSSETSQIVQTT